MIIAIVQARLGSQRLPGKVLSEVRGKSLLSYIMERLELCEGLDAIKVAVPLKDHEAIYAALKNHKCEVVGVPGDENDVARRFRYVLGEMQDKFPKAFVRLCADSPLIDPVLVDWMIEQYEGGLLTNTKPRTFPAGQCVEIMDAKGFIGLRSGDTKWTAEDREHVTPWFYRNCRFKNTTTPDGKDYSHVNMCIDTYDDFLRVAGVIEKMDRPHTTYGWRELAGMMQ